ncbi:hypothetical protein ACFX1Q_024303 [Malus domestica]
MTSSLLFKEASGLKRGVEPPSMDLLPSPKKKTRGPESETDRKGKMAEKLRGMNIKERCLMVDRVIYVEDEFHEVPLEIQDMWEYLEVVSEEEKRSLLA